MSEKLSPQPPSAEQLIEAEKELVLEIGRELFDRFVMGGWEPADAFPQIIRWIKRLRLAAPGVPPLDNLLAGVNSECRADWPKLQKSCGCRSADECTHKFAGVSQEEINQIVRDDMEKLKRERAPGVPPAPPNERVCPECKHPLTGDGKGKCSVAGCECEASRVIAPPTKEQGLCDWVDTTFSEYPYPQKAVDWLSAMESKGDTSGIAGFAELLRQNFPTRAIGYLLEEFARAGVPPEKGEGDDLCGKEIGRYANHIFLCAFPTNHKSEHQILYTRAATSPVGTPKTRLGTCGDLTHNEMDDHDLRANPVGSPAEPPSAVSSEPETDDRRERAMDIAIQRRKENIGVQSYCYGFNDGWDAKLGAEARTQSAGPETAMPPKMCKCGHSDDEHDDGVYCCMHRSRASLFCTCDEFQPAPPAGEAPPTETKEEA